MNNLGRIARRMRRTLLQAVPTVLVIVVINFFLLQMAPGDAVDIMAAESGAATEETMAALRRQFGLDMPMLPQLYSYLYNLAHFDLGFSPRYGKPVLDLIMERLPDTLLLMGSALTLAVSLGLMVGSVMAFFAGRLPDRVLSVLSLLFYSIPSFWIGLMMIVLFSVKLGWLPSGGSGTIGADLSGLAAVLDKLRFLALPALSLGLIYAAVYARLTRASVLEVKSQDFVRTARAKGLPARIVNVRHVLRNALIPVTTMAGMHVSGFVGGAVVIETVFSWPGLGRLAYEAVMARDFILLLSILLLSSLLVIATNMIVDLLYSAIDPRIGAS